MSKSVVILGRQPALGLAELERLYGADAIQPLSGGLAILDKDPSDVDFARLGGTVKIARLLDEFDTTDWRKIIAKTEKLLPNHLSNLPEEGKIRLGLNSYGFAIGVADINRAGLQLKKIIKKAGRSVRVVPNTALELNSAQTLHNQLTGPTGWEFVFIRTESGTTLLAQVTASQNIEAYADRDRQRPKRDTRVGMLPPKLAQIIVNLSNPEPGATVLDPFCGTGVILQEAILMGYKAYGTDLEPRMAEYSQENLEWLKHKIAHNIFHFPDHVSSEENLSRLAIGDATSYQWEQPFTTVAAETYLGRPFSSVPEHKVLEEVMQDVDTIHRKFLRNLATQTEPGFQLCIAVPAWHTTSGVKHLKMLDSLEDLGYTRMSFVHANNNDLVYHRQNQVVGRELVVLTRK